MRELIRTLQLRQIDGAALTSSLLAFPTTSNLLRITQQFILASNKSSFLHDLPIILVCAQPRVLVNHTCLLVMDSVANQPSFYATLVETRHTISRIPQFLGMPYTPPSHQSPASSRTSTPAISRSSSYVGELHNNRGAISPRPNLPRSVSSTAYLNKHRRSPSATHPSEDGDKHDTTKSNEAAIAANGSLRQSPPPLNNLLIPTGAILSPPDSSENSDGDDKDVRQPRSHELDTAWGELQQAVRSMSLKREHSPAKAEALTLKTNGAPQETVIEPITSTGPSMALSPEARKISHSRSNTETAINTQHHNYTESPNHTSDDSDEGDYGHGGKPPLVRKKSGELVKPALRPSSRRRYSSMPGTPTYHKSVHFNDNGNQTRHFLQVDKPMAVSAGSSPVESAYESETEYPFENNTAGPRVEWEMKMANFSANLPERKYQPVYVERFFLSADTKSLIGSIAVANISFHKSVTARFTLDYWKTTSEVAAEFSHDVRKVQANDGYDRFNFTIRLADQANLESKTLLLCVKYSVNGQEHWDNNNGSNYQIDFVKKASKKVKITPQSSLGARPLNAIPRSRHSPPATARGRAPSIDDDIVNRFDSSSSAYHFGSPDQIIGDSFADPSTTLKLKPRTKRGSVFPGSAPAQASNGLGGRYDFGASLSAALSNAQDKLGRQSGLMGQQGPQPASGYFSQDPAREVTPIPDVESPRPDAATTDRPAMGSAQYRDLVSKFCYVGSRATASS